MTDFSLIARFALVGGSTGLLYMGLTYALVEGMSMNATLASTISTVTTICYNYVLHYHWTFASDAPHGRVLARYLTMCVGAVLINALVMLFGIEMLSVHYLIVQFFAGLAITCWSIVASTLWVFRES